MLTLRHLQDSFLTHIKMLVRAGTNAPATLEWYTNQLQHLKALDDFPAEALRTHHLAAIEMNNGFVRALKRLYKWAAAEELVPKDPFASLSTPPCGQRERVLSRDEVAKLYRACSRAFRRLLFLQFHTLARPGEIRQLSWGQINWQERVIVLMQFKGKKKRKDKLRARLIPLDHCALRLLRNLYRKSADKSDAGRVFLSTRGKPWSYNATRCAMRRARVKAGLDAGDEPVVCYHLRHTGATEAVRRNLNLKLIAEVMGHARTTTTERYTHLSSTDVVNAIDRLSARPRANRAG